jgi:hypothetical protein
LLLRAVTRDSLGWARRSAVAHTRWNGGSIVPSLNRNGNGRGELRGPGNAVDGDGVRRRNSGTLNLTWGRAPTAGSTKENHSNDAANGHLVDQGPAPYIARQDESGQPEDKQESSIDGE